MADTGLPFEGEVIHDLPDELAMVIGRVMVSYARLEHQLTALTGLLLQLNKAEARIVLRTPRATERLDMALDLFAIKSIEVRLDTQELRETLASATSRRDVLAHGIWLRRPRTNELYLRLTRGTWPKAMTRGQPISRAVFPQSIPYSVADCRETLALIDQAMAGVNQLGQELDDALRTFPERFRPPSPVLNPLGSRSPKGKPRPPQP